MVLCLLGKMPSVAKSLYNVAKNKNAFRMYLTIAPPPQYGEMMPNRMPASGVATALEVVQLREESCVRSKHNYHIFTHFVDAWPITFDCYLLLIVCSSFLNLSTPFRVVMNEFVTPLLNVEDTLQNQKVHYIVQPYWQLVIISKLSVNTDSTCTLTLETV